MQIVMYVDHPYKVWWLGFLWKKPANIRGSSFANGAFKFLHYILIYFFCAEARRNSASIQRLNDYVANFADPSDA